MPSMNELVNIVAERFGPDKPVFLQEMLRALDGVSERAASAFPSRFPARWRS